MKTKLLTLKTENYGQPATLSNKKHRPVVPGSVHDEFKTAAKTLKSDPNCSDRGIDLILKRLDEAYAIDESNQVDADLANFPDRSWETELSIEHFISRFHSPVDNISPLNELDELKCHLILRYASLAYYEVNVVTGTSSGIYDVNKVSAALHSIY